MRRMFNSEGYVEAAPCNIVVIIISCVNIDVSYWYSETKQDEISCSE